MPRIKRTVVLTLTALGASSALGGGGHPENPCDHLQLPATWDVRARVYADVTGDGTPECVLSVWRPWKDWPIARWSKGSSPITANHDPQGYSSHVAVLRPLSGGQYRNIWVGSALFRPVTVLQVTPDQTLVTWETTYHQGRKGNAVTVSEWRWTGFGFSLLSRRVLGSTP